MPRLPPPTPRWAAFRPGPAPLTPGGGKGHLAEDDPDLVRDAVVGERDRGDAVRQLLPVYLRRCHAATDPLWVLHDDLVPGGVIAEVDLIARPPVGDAGIQ